MSYFVLQCSTSSFLYFCTANLDVLYLTISAVVSALLCNAATSTTDAASVLYLPSKDHNLEHASMFLHFVFLLKSIKRNEPQKRISRFKQYQSTTVYVPFLSIARSWSLSCSFCVFQGVVMNTKSVWTCVCVRLLWFSLFASGLGMKGPEGLVREARADVSWPVGTRFSRITLPSQAGFGSVLTSSCSLSLLHFPSPFFP